MEVKPLYQIALAIGGLLLSFIVFCGCDPAWRQIRQNGRDNIALIENCISNDSHADVGDSLEAFLCRQVTSMDRPAVLYCVNTSCSVCIGEFCQFAASVSRYPEVEVVAMVDKGTAETFAYHTEKMSEQYSWSFKTVALDDLEFFFICTSLPEGGQGFLLSEGKVIDCVGVSEGKLFCL